MHLYVNNLHMSELSEMWLYLSFIIHAFNYETETVGILSMEIQSRLRDRCSLEVPIEIHYQQRCSKRYGNVN